jgi:hypothetical protein
MKAEHVRRELICASLAAAAAGGIAVWFVMVISAVPCAPTASDPARGSFPLQYTGDGEQPSLQTARHCLDNKALYKAIVDEYDSYDVGAGASAVVDDSFKIRGAHLTHEAHVNASKVSATRDSDVDV